MNLELIDTSTTAGKAEVMRLAAEGRRVRWRFRGDAQWLVDVGDDWDWKSCEYAIISEPAGPEEVYMAVCGSDQIKAVVGTKKGAKEWGGLPVVRYIRADLAGEGKP